MSKIHGSVKTIIVFILATGILGLAVLLVMMKTVLKASNTTTIQHDVWVEIFYLRCQTTHGKSMIARWCLRSGRIAHIADSVFRFYRQLQSMIGDTVNRVSLITVSFLWVGLIWRK